MSQVHAPGNDADMGFKPLPTRPKLGPTFRDCQSCHTKPARGVMSIDANNGYGLQRSFIHVCMKCADPDTFEPYSEGDKGDDEC